MLQNGNANNMPLIPNIISVSFRFHLLLLEAYHRFLIFYILLLTIIKVFLYIPTVTIVGVGWVLGWEIMGGKEHKIVNESFFRNLNGLGRGIMVNLFASR